MKNKLFIILVSLMAVLCSFSLAGCVTCEHQLVVVEVVAPTCDHDGYTISRCNLCSMIITGDYVEAYGHEYIGEGKVVEPTCTEDGYTLFKCQRCGEDVKAYPVEAIGHQYDIVNNVIKSPTCTEVGTSDCICSLCGKREIIEVEALGHDFEGIGEVSGYETQQCTRCDVKVTSPIKYTITYYLNGGTASNPTEYTVESEPFTLNKPTRRTHIFLGWTWAGQTEPVQSVTIQKGTTGNKVYEANWEKIVCENHVLNGVVITTDTLDAETPGVIEFSGKNATCSQNGSGMYTCEVCEEVVVVTTTKEHQFNKNTIQEYIKQPTCTEKGKVLVYCVVCEKDVEANIPALGHTFSSQLVEKDGKAILVLTCSVCGHVDEEEINVVSNYIPSTCQEPGLITYLCLDHTGKILTLDIQLETTPHVLNGMYVGSWLSADTEGVSEFANRESTCTEDGLGMYVCECCNGTYMVNTYMSHNYDKSSVNVTKAPTCTEDGEGLAYCEDCKTNVKVVLHATGHDYKYEVIEAPTASKVGKVKVTCESAGCSFSVDCYLPKLSYDGYVISKNGSRTEYSIYLYEYGVKVTIVA